MAFNTTINQLSGTSTFYDWFIKENTEIISKLNQATVSGVTSGDGVLATLDASSGIVTVSIGGTSGVIYTGLTFNGSVSFVGETVIPNNSFKITGITSGSAGYSFGSVVRVTATGYTLAQANNPDAAEMIGVISSLNTNYSVVTTSGKISGNFTSVSGGTLSPGCVYFLSPTSGGNITTTEPTTIGHVSKPVIVGLGETAGLVLQYRGNYLNGSASSGGSGANRIYFTLPASSNAGNYGFSAGYFVSYAKEQLDGNTFMHQYLVDTGRTSIDGWFLSSSNDVINFLTSNYNKIVGEEDFIIGMIENVTTSGSDNIYQVIVNGQTTVVPYSIGSYSGSKQGIWFISGVTYNVLPSGITQLAATQVGQYNPKTKVGTVFDPSVANWYVDIKKVNIGNLGGSATVTGNDTTDLGNAINYAYNGDFSVWQRSTGKNSSYTSATRTYFADSWIMRHSGIAAGSIQSLQRYSFASTSTEVEGNPQYYTKIKCIADPGGANPTGGEHSIGHVFEGVNTFNGSTITVSFYSKCELSGYSINVYFARYSNGSLVSKNNIDTVDLTTSWTKYSLQYQVPELTATTPFGDDYLEIGIDLIPIVEKAYSLSLSTGTNATVSLASFNVFNGSYKNPNHNFELYREKVSKAQRYFYTTYTNDQTIGTPTMISDDEPKLNVYTFTYLPNSPFSLLKLPTDMRSDPTVTIYSPKTALQPEMYNYTARRDLRYCGRTTGYNGAIRSPVIGSPSVTTTQDTNSIRINIGAGAVPYDVLNCHIVADASYPI